MGLLKLGFVFTWANMWTGVFVESILHHKDKRIAKSSKALVPHSTSCTAHPSLNNTVTIVAIGYRNCLPINAWKAFPIYNTDKLRRFA
ncbi:unnamed protein product [Prunus brigantina]